MELCVSVGQGRESKLIGSVKLGDYKDDSVVLSTVESSKVVFLKVRSVAWHHSQRK